MFIDFNSFFASVEQELRPELRDRPVVVVPLMAETTCCIAASYQAKPFGIKTGTPVHEARRLCPDLEVIEARPERYVRCHKFLNKTIIGMRRLAGNALHRRGALPTLGRMDGGRSRLPTGWADQGGH